MMLKTSNGFLDFNEHIELERQSLLFEELDETRGDFSYSFSIPWTAHNLEMLEIPLADNVGKIVYQRIDADLMSESGTVLHRGFLRIEQVIHNRAINCSFFSGNSNWISLIAGDMTELDLRSYDIDITKSNIEASWSLDSGLVFPVIDTGVLIDRSLPTILPEDFVGSFYLHTLFKEVFTQAGIKLDGELLQDHLFNRIVIVTNTRSKIDIDANSMYVGITPQNIPILGASTLVFDLQADPYYVGSDVVFNSDTTYVAQYDMIVDASATIESIDPAIWTLRVNNKLGGLSASYAGINPSLIIRNLRLRAGDTLNVTVSFASDVNVTKGTFKVTPQFIYRSFGRSGVPLWTKLEFVSNVMSLFNTVSDYDPYSKTLTVNLFEKVKNRQPLDISPYVQVDEVDYVDFISNYGKKSLLTYSEGSDEEIQAYNISSYVEYGAGVINVNNGFLPDTETILESDFAAPVSYINPVFGASFEKISFVEYEDTDDIPIDSVTDSSGAARFNFDTDYDDLVSVYDVIRIQSRVLTYNGTYIVSAVGSGYLELQGVNYDSNGDVEMTRVVHKFTNDDSVYLMVHTKTINVEDVSATSSEWNFRLTPQEEYSLAFFNLLNNGTAINDRFKQGLSFGEVTDPSSYQRTLIDTYWRATASVLNDPVKLTLTAHLPEVIYNQLSPLRPVYIKSEESTNLYYVNRVTGYDNSSVPCTIELIKLP